MTGTAPAVVAAFAIGCAGPVRVVHPQACIAKNLGSEPPPELLMPRSERPFMPPMPVPSTTHGRRMVVRVIVDTTGRVMQDSVTICGIEDPLYIQRVAEEISAMRFRPGLMNAKHVIAPSVIAFDF